MLITASFSCSTNDSTQNLWNLSCPISWTEIHLSHSQIPQKNVFSLKSWCIGCLATIVVRRKRTSDSCSSPLETTWEHHFDEILVYRLPTNHCGPKETDVGFVFLTSGNHLGTPFRWNPGVSVAYQPLWSEGNGRRIRVPHLWKPPGNTISMKSWCIGCLPGNTISTIVWSGGNGPRIRVPHIELPQENPFSMKSWCIGCLATIVVRGKRTSDSSSPHRFSPRTIVTPRNKYPCR